MLDIRYIVGLSYSCSNRCRYEHDTESKPFRFQSAKAVSSRLSALVELPATAGNRPHSGLNNLGGVFPLFEPCNCQTTAYGGLEANERSRYNATARTGLISLGSSFYCQPQRCNSGPREKAVSRLGLSAALDCSKCEATMTDGQNRQANHLLITGQGWFVLAQTPSGQYCNK